MLLTSTRTTEPRTRNAAQRLSAQHGIASRTRAGDPGGSSEEASRLKPLPLQYEPTTPHSVESVIALPECSADVSPPIPAEEFSYLSIERNGRICSLLSTIFSTSHVSKPAEESKLIVLQTTYLPIGKGIGTSGCENGSTSSIPSRDKIYPSPATRQCRISSRTYSECVKFKEKGTVGISVQIPKRGESGGAIRESLAPAALPHIFDEFRQADGSTSRKYAVRAVCIAKSTRLAGGTIRLPAYKEKVGIHRDTSLTISFGKIATETPR